MTVVVTNLLNEYPAKIFYALAEICEKFKGEMYFAGGAVRDWYSGERTGDLDITVSGDAFSCASQMAARLGGAYVPLDESEGVARVVWRDLIFDFSSFREGARSIEEDLQKRDFTINAMAVRFEPEKGIDLQSFQVIDPTGGIRDVKDKIIRATSDQVFEKDPLRLLRAYRFAATLDFKVEEKTGQLITSQAHLLERTAPERISYELEKIMQSPRAYQGFSAIAASGLLWEIIPELHSGVGQVQPQSHHLDVFSHNLATLAWMEKICAAPQEVFPKHHGLFVAYLSTERVVVLLKWAALLHDIGKPSTCALREDKAELSSLSAQTRLMPLRYKITFHNHDKAGERMVKDICARLRWSRRDTEKVLLFIGLHMWPFHLNNVRVRDGVSARACLRLIKATGHEFPGLFLLAMADSLAGQGKEKPAGMEESLAMLFCEVEAHYRESIRPVLTLPRLLDGHELQHIFKLQPGPIFKEIFEGIEQAQVEKKVITREDAIAWVQEYIRENKGDRELPPIAR
ncbi:MAG: HD domain-containing protein [Proteobacteria bacterium]|nr:HD domain-containing protein [Pseudomonadota bacterium]MBU1711098.1 HD domain-containing protein [Pseudomonadota bacterium]